MFHSASSWRMGRAFAGLASLVMATGFYFLFPMLGLDTAKFNRTSGEGTPQRTLIEALVSIRDGEVTASSWQSSICHEDVCADFEGFSQEQIAPIRAVAPQCLVDGEKIQMKPPGGKLLNTGTRERQFWVRCQGGDAWLEVILKPEKRPIPGEKGVLPWLITSMRQVAEVPGT